jgi:hypothetical protein
MSKLAPKTLQRQAEEYDDLNLSKQRAQELAVELDRLNMIVRESAESLVLTDEPAAYATFLDQGEI